MQVKFRGAWRGMLWAGTTIAALGGMAGAAVAQDDAEYAPPAIRVQVAPSEGGDVTGIVNELRVTAAPAWGAAGAGGAVYFAQPWGEDPSSLLNWGNVQEELELLDDQREKIRDAQRQMRERMQKHIAEMREQHQQRIREMQERQGNAGDVPSGGNAGGGFAPRIVQPTADFRKSQEVEKALRDELAKNVEDVLLPHQKKRLEEISFRMKMKHRGTSGALVDSQLAKALDIDDAQKERIQKRAIEVQQDLEEKIAKLREEAREQILDELSPGQRRKLDDLLGAEFDERPRPIVRPHIESPRPPAVKRVETKDEREDGDDAEDRSEREEEARRPRRR
jgi:hypothetical protein